MEKQTHTNIQTTNTHAAHTQVAQIRNSTHIINSLARLDNMYIYFDPYKDQEIRQLTQRMEEQQ